MRFLPNFPSPSKEQGASERAERTVAGALAIGGFQEGRSVEEATSHLLFEIAKAILNLVERIVVELAPPEANALIGVEHHRASSTKKKLPLVSLHNQFSSLRRNVRIT